MRDGGCGHSAADEIRYPFVKAFGFGVGIATGAGFSCSGSRTARERGRIRR
jgi:hypothetical protein